MIDEARRLRVGEETRGSYGDWYIQRGAERFVAPDIETVQAWARSGRLSPSDQVHHSSFGGAWVPAGDVDTLRGYFDPHRTPAAPSGAVGVPNATKWYRSTAFHIILLFLAPYIQVVVMWTQGVFTRRTRMQLTCVALVLTCLLAVSLANDKRRLPKEDAFAERFEARQGEREYEMTGKPQDYYYRQGSNVANYYDGVVKNRRGAGRSVARRLTNEELDKALADPAVIDAYADEAWDKKMTPLLEKSRRDDAEYRRRTED